MNRIDAARETVSRNFASRPVRVALAVKIAFAIMAANVSFAAAKAVFHKADADAPAVAASVSAVKPFILPVAEKAQPAPQIAATIELASLPGCREIVTQTDDGYGVRGSVTRTICRKAL